MIARKQSVPRAGYSKIFAVIGFLLCLFVVVTVALSLLIDRYQTEIDLTSSSGRFLRIKNNRSRQSYETTSISSSKSGILLWRVKPAGCNVILGTGKSQFMFEGSILVSKSSHHSQFENGIGVDWTSTPLLDNSHNNNNTSPSCDVSTFMQDFDIHGYDLPLPELQESASPLECCKFCLMFPDCNAWSFNGICWVKYAPTEKLSQTILKPNLGVISGFLPTKIFHKETQTQQQTRLNQAGISGSVIHNIDSLVHRSPTKLNREPTIQPYLLLRDVTSVDWTEQWPIGNGKIGALVGGTRTQEIVPLSIAGLYFVKKTNKEKNRGESSDADPVSRRTEFLFARENLRKGDYNSAKENIQKISGGVLGTFQYVADIIFQYGTYSHQFKTIPQANKPTPGSRPNNIGKGSRLELFQALSDNIETTSVNISYNGILKPLVSESALDLQNGTSYWEFVEEDAVNSLLYFNTREWFASAIDDVIVNEVKCEKVVGENSTIPTNDSGCINAAIHLSRSNSPDLEVSWHVNVTSMELPKVYDTTEHKTVSFDISFGANDNVLVPNVHVCGVVVCSSDQNLGQSLPEIDYQLKPLPIILCNGASKMTTIVSVSLYQDKTSLYNVPGDSSVLLENITRVDCWKKLNSALKYDVEELRARHTTDFFEKMSETEIFLEEKDIRRGRSISQIFQHSRYLMLSSSRSSVSNLQGLWADGPSSSWSGDYHLNINLEQAYWAAGSSGMTFLYKPLLDFVEKLSELNSSALEIYNSRGFVAHGFLDSFTLNTGLLGDPQWSLCVTCGAWIALSLWEALLYSDPSANDLQRTLNIFRKVVVFFIDYIWEDDNTGYVHTGPTTSPENSYRLKDSSDLTKPKLEQGPQLPDQINFLSFSPAIDISILRQVSNVFSILVDIIGVRKDHFEHSYQDDLALSKLFDDLVHRLPGNGLPLVSKSGLIMEYPDPLPGVAIAECDIQLTNCAYLDQGNAKTKLLVDETLDFGHRHYSGMHWLYPAIFPVEGPQEDMLMTASARTLDKKEATGGAHTSWSAAWGASLWARLKNGDKALNLLYKIIDQYTLDNFYSLHPPLQSHNEVGLELCETCFKEVGNSNKEARKHMRGRNDRGLVTQDDSKFQLDGSLGFLASLNEMLIQSQSPGRLVLLPALPLTLPAGELRGFVARGNVKIDLKWNSHIILSANLEFRSSHFWNQIETKPCASKNNTKHHGLRKMESNLENDFGFYEISFDSRVISIHTPNRMVLSKSISACAIEVQPADRRNIESGQLKNFYRTDISIQQFPCKVALISSLK